MADDYRRTFVRVLALGSDRKDEAVAATRACWPHEPVPEYGMITFVDGDAVRSSNPGYCYQHAGFCKVGVTNPELAHGMIYDLLGDL